MRLPWRSKGSISTATLAEPATVLTGRPAELPDADALARLAAVCARYPQLAAVHATQRLIVAEGEIPTLVLGLVFDDERSLEQAGTIIEDIGSAAHPLRPGDASFDAEVLDAAPAGEGWVPLYERS